MVFVMVEGFEFDVGIVFLDFLELQFQICKNSFINHLPSVSGGDDDVVVAVVDGMTGSLVLHPSSISYRARGTRGAHPSRELTLGGLVRG